MNDANTRLSQLRDSCPGASPDDLLRLVEDHATVEAGLRHWTATLAARLENRDEEVATLRTTNRQELDELKARLAAEVAAKDRELAAEKHRLKIVREGLDC